MTIRAIRPTVLGFLVALLLAACAAPPPPPPPTVAELTITAAEGLNPDPSGRPSPVVVRVYQLASPTAFGEADFFKLYDSDAATLGAAMLSRDELTISPGQVKTLTREFTDSDGVLGIAVFYRDFDRAVWRASVAVPPHETTKIDAALGPRTVQLAVGS